MTDVQIDDDKYLETNFVATQWPNYIQLKSNLVQEIDTNDEREASWEWEIESEWIRLS